MGKKGLSNVAKRKCHDVDVKDRLDQRMLSYYCICINFFGLCVAIVFLLRRHSFVQCFAEATHHDP